MTTTTEEQATPNPGAAFAQVITSAVEFAAAKLSQKADGRGGAQQHAGVKGVQAGLQGKNPVWAAIKGAWSGGAAKVKAAIVAAVVALVLLLVLSPVLLLAFLLGLLVIAAVAKARAAGD
jgi:hypothetical protein